MFYKTFKISCLGIALALSSCTLSTENDEPTSPTDSYRLTSITAGGVFTISRLDYDSQGRIAQVVMEDSKIEFSYQGNNTLPSEIAEIEYYSYDGTIYEGESITWSDMVYNEKGLLVSASYTEKTAILDYSYDDMSIPYETTYSVQKHEYDAAGHMIKSICHTDGESDEITTLVWENDLLIKTYDNVSPIETTEFEYSNVVNSKDSFDPFTAVGNFLNITGIFGKNPGKFVKKITYSQAGSYSEVSQFAYSLNSNGLIDKVKVNEDGEEITYKFNYSTK